MLVLSILILSIVSISLFLIRRDIITFYMVAMAVCFSIMYVGIIIYIAKIGDFNEGQRKFLFLYPELKNKLQYLPWTLSRIGWLVALGRTLFPYFLLKLALELTMIPSIRRRKGKIGFIAIVIPCLLLLYYYPYFFRYIVKDKFYLLEYMIYTARIYILLYVGIAITLILVEYFSITIGYCKKNLRFVILMIIGITALYSLYVIQDPAQIYHFYIYEYIDINSLMYIKPSIVQYGYAMIGGLSIIFAIACVMGIYGYIYHDVKEERTTKNLKRHFKLRSMGISVFSHSVKNQLLASRILIKRINEEIKKDNIQNQKIIEYLEQLQSYNEDTLKNMNRYYKMVSETKVDLKPILIEEVLQMAVEQFVKKYGECNIQVENGTSGMIIGDAQQLSEALFNIMDNGYEASHKPIQVQLNNERLYFVIVIKDKGKGMERKEMKMIFKPFFTNKVNSSSWGLGLYFTHLIVKNHYGYIKLSSKVGIGSEFYIMLPKYKKDR